MSKLTNDNTPTALEDISPFHGNFGRIKMIIYGVVIPSFTMPYLYINMKHLTSFFNIESTLIPLLIIIGLPLIMILYSIFKRSRDIDENPYFNIIVLFIPILNLYFLIDLFLTKGYPYHRDIDDEWYDDLDDE